MSPQMAMDYRRRALSALRQSPIYDLRVLCVESSEGSLLLSGSVSSFYHKQLAQELVRSTVQGVSLVNSITVLPLAAG